MQKYKVDPNDQEIMEALALGALIILDMVENAETKTPPQTDHEPDQEKDR